MRSRLLFLALLRVLLTFPAEAQDGPATPIYQLKQALAQAPHDSIRLRLCVSIGSIYVIQNQFDSLYRYTQLGIELLKQSPSPYYAGDLYNFLGRYYRHRNQYPKGIPLLQQAIQYAQQAGSARKTAQFHYTLAMLYSDAGDLSKAIDQIGTNLKYLQQHRDDSMLGANYLLIIELFKVLNNTAMQALYTNRYLALVKPDWPADDQMLVYNLKGEILEKQGHLKAAETMFRKAMHFARRTGHPAYIGEALFNQAINYRKQGQHGRAIATFNEMYALVNRVKDKFLMASSKRELAMTYLADKQARRALPHARQALQLSYQNRQVDGILASLHSLVLILEANGQFAEALAMYRDEQQRREKHFNVQNMQKIAHMQAEFETETKENTIRLLQKNAQINQLATLRQQEQLNSARRIQVAAAVIIGLLTLLMVVVYYFFRKSQQNNRLLKQQRELIEKSAAELAELNLTKDKLFSLIGHDLRSPLASVKKNIGQIRSAEKEPDLLLPLVSRLESQVDMMLTLLTNLLDWSMIQLKGFQSILKPIRLRDIGDDVLAQAGEQIRAKNITIIDHIDSTHYVLADKHQLQAVFRNVLANAIKFTPRGGYIRVVSLMKDEQIELQIRDSGQGMSAEQLSRIFSSPDPQMGTEGERGAGLGLQICREMMDRQHGSFHIQNGAKGGAIVGIRLAVSTNHAPLQPA